MFLKEELLPEEKRYLIRYLNCNYDYCYLDAMHNQLINSSTEVIVTGSSHGLDAINTERMPVKAVNLSMHTQDLYFDLLNVKKAMQNNCKMKVCVATIGYYSLHYDLSRTSYNYRCYEVYKPLLNDIHNAAFNDVGNRFVYPGYEERDFYCSYFGNYKNYYGPAVLREHTNGEIRKKGGWANLSDEQRLIIAKERAEKHNKHKKYIDTYKENCEVLCEYAKLCHENNIRFIIVVMPFSHEYLQYIDKAYKELILEQLNMIPYEIEFADLNEADCYSSEDFVDADHCSDIGAEKATKLLTQIICG